MDFYSQYVQIERQTGTQMYAKCPFHADVTASLTINTQDETWYCHACAVGGKQVQFIEKYYDVSHEIAEKAYQNWQSRGTMQFPTQSYIELTTRNLAQRPKEIEVLHSFGISDAIIQQFQVGHDGDIRFTFPIKSRTGQFINMRYYLPPHRRQLQSPQTPKVKNRIDCGATRFYPYCAFDEPIIVIVEGEKDMLSARSHGINAITGTGGTNIPQDEINMFKGHTVYVAVDSDGPGCKLADKYMRILRPIAKSVQRILYPAGTKDYVEFWQAHPEKDLMEYVQKSLFSAANVRATSAPKEDWAEDVPVDIVQDVLMEGRGNVDDVLLVASEDVTQLNTWIKLSGMSIIGTDPKTYTVPIKLRPDCKNAKCSKDCAAQNSNFYVDVEPRQIVQFVDSSDNVQHAYLKGLFGCRDMIAAPVDYINVQKILFQESASFRTGLEDSSFEHRFGMFLYDQNRLSPTQKYDFECMRVTDPSSQQNYYVIRAADQVTDIELPQGTEYLLPFQHEAAKHTSLRSLLEAYNKEWLPILNIEGRTDLFGALLLTYLSVTEISWRGGILKGWLDTMVIGDTRTGKSQMAQRMVKALDLGSYINGENARATGVIGGVQKLGDSWVITWGAIPMNDKGMLVIDEASGLSVDDIKDLSATRSSGAVTINKIAKGEARARTRLMWLSNPRSGRNLEEFYWRGYGAFTEFIPIVEDQARFDVVLTAAREDVPILKNYQDLGTPPDMQKWRSLIKFAWSIEASQIQCSHEVAQYIAAQAKALDEIYGGGPLVVGVAVHEKIIRLTCAIAILCGSMSPDGKQLLLKNYQVDYAIEFLRMCFDKPSLDYAGYIKDSRRAQKERNSNTDYIRVIMQQYPALKVILASNVFRAGHLRDVIGADSREASVLLSELLKRGLLKVTGSGAYAPTKLLIEIAKQMDI